MIGFDCSPQKPVPVSALDSRAPCFLPGTPSFDRDFSDVNYYPTGRLDGTDDPDHAHGDHGTVANVIRRKMIVKLLT